MNQDIPLIRVLWRRLFLIGLLSATIATAQSGTAAKREIDPESIGPGKRVRREIPDTVRVERDIVYARYGNRELQLDLYLPKNPDAENIPCIVSITGGGWHAGDKTRFAGISAALADHGFASACITYRVLPEVAFPAPIMDCKAAVRWVRANAADYGIDPDHIGVIGGSAGAQLAALLGVSADMPEFEGDGGNAGVSSRVQAVVAMAAPSDMTYYAERAGLDQEMATLVSPIKHVSADSTPLLLMHGTKDGTVLYWHSERFLKVYQESGASAELVKVPDGVHAFWNFEIWFDDTIERAVAFFRRELKQGASVDESKTSATNTPPKLRNMLSPGYPLELQDSGISGTVMLSLTVKANGTVDDVAVVSSDHPAFSRAAMAVIPEWRFEPGKKDGRVADIKLKLPVKFIAPFEQQVNATLQRKVFRPLEEPVFTVQEYGDALVLKEPGLVVFPAERQGSGELTEVKVEFVVGPDGTTLNPVALGEPDMDFVPSAIAAVARTVYEPPMKEGQGVYVRTTTTVTFDPQTLTNNETRRRGQSRQRAGGRGDPERMRSQFERFDRNGDGRLSGAEVEGRRGSRILERFDHNGDGIVTLEEVLQLASTQRTDAEAGLEGEGRVSVVSEKDGIFGKAEKLLAGEPSDPFIDPKVGISCSIV